MEAANIKDTGPLTKKRMETIDDEVNDRALRFIDKAHKDGKPFFIWWNSTAHALPDASSRSARARAARAITTTPWSSMTSIIGKMLEKLDELGIADDTIVIYSTDNGPHFNTWPDAGITPFRSEKNTNWEGAFRVPAFVRWPGKIQAGTVINGIVSHQDWLPTLLAAAGEPDITEKLLHGHTRRQDFQGAYRRLNMLPYLDRRDEKEPARSSFLCQ